ncbi:MAG: zinc ABC transporter substrate-binding protein [Planctomycetota bacterium]
MLKGPVLRTIRRRCLFATAASLLTLTGCGSDSPDGAERTPLREVVAVASAPAEFFTTVAIGGGPAVERLGEQLADAATWSPSDSDLAALVSARRTLLLGFEFEPWAQRAGLPPSRTITLADGVDAAALISTATVTHTHGNGPAHSHGGIVPTAWTSPQILRTLMHETGERLAGALTLDGADAKRRGDEAVARRTAFEASVSAYEAELTSLQQALRGRALIAAGHGFEYIARAVEAPLTVVLLEDGSNDHATDLLEQASAKSGHAGVLLWRGEVHQALADAIEAEHGLASLSLDLGSRGEGATVLDRLTVSIRKLTQEVR